MYQSQLGFPFSIQQVVTGTGAFNGTEQGRAKAAITTSGNPNSIVYVAARLIGTIANAITVSFVDAGAGVAVGATTVSQIGNVIQVRLRRSTGAILATSAEVAAAINAFPGFALPIKAEYQGTGAGVVAATVAPVALSATAAGLDPLIRGEGRVFVWDYALNSNAGFFFLENDRDPLVLRFLSGKFTVGGGTHWVRFSRANIDFYGNVIASSSIPFFFHDQLTTAKPDIAVSDPRTILQPGQAVIVETDVAMAGTVQLDLQRAAGYPSL